MPGLLAGRVYEAWTRGVMEWLCCRCVAISGYICMGKSRGCWEGVAVKADALARRRGLVLLFTN